LKKGIVVVSKGGKHYRKIISYLDVNAREGVRRADSISEALNIIYKADADVLIADLGEERRKNESLPIPNSPRQPAYNALGDARDNMHFLVWYINTHCKDKLTLKTLAPLIGVTPNYLCRVFKAETGYTVTRYVEKIRLQEAARELVMTELYVQDIAIKYGYRNDSYFARVFKREFGLTPSEYREKMRSKSAECEKKEEPDT